MLELKMKLNEEVGIYVGAEDEAEGSWFIICRQLQKLIFAKLILSNKIKVFINLIFYYLLFQIAEP